MKYNDFIQVPLVKYIIKVLEVHNSRKKTVICGPVVLTIVWSSVKFVQFFLEVIVVER